MPAGNTAGLGNRMEALQGGCNGRRSMKPYMLLYRLLGLFGKKGHQKMNSTIKKLALHSYGLSNEKHQIFPMQKGVGLHLCSEALGKPCHNKGAHAVT